MGMNSNDYDGNAYNDNDTTNVFEVPSTIDFPDMRSSHPMAPSSAPDVAFGGFGTGGETLNSDGSVSTRYKSVGGTTAGGDVDGGTP